MSYDPANPRHALFHQMSAAAAQRDSDLDQMAARHGYRRPPAAQLIPLGEDDLPLVGFIGAMMSAGATPGSVISEIRRAVHHGRLSA